MTAATIKALTFNRRRMLLAMGGTLLVGCERADPPTGTFSLALGVQLYSVRDAFARDPFGVLEALAELGIKELEFAGLGGQTAPALRARMDALQLTAPAMHAALERLETDLDATMAEAQALGCDYIVVPYVMEKRRTSMADWRSVFSSMNVIASRLAGNDLKFAYHAHGFEFAPLDGEIPYDAMLAETDSGTVLLEMDFYWMAVAGRDPKTVFDAYPGRVALAHLKDRSADGSMANVGQGTLDFKALLTLAKAAGLHHGFIERDDLPAPYYDGIAASASHLLSLRH